MSKALTAKQVQHMKPTPGKRIEVPAGPPSGLFLVLHPTGTKGWAFRYRRRGRTRNLTFKQKYPDMTLAAARAEAESYLAKLEEDIDPAVVQSEEIQQETPESVKAVADEWIKRYVKANAGERSQKEFKRILDKEVLPLWKDKFITEIRKADVLRVLDALSDRGTPALANKTLAVMKMWLTWCAEDRDYIDASPAAGIRPPSKNVSRERVLKPTELLEVWTAAGAIEYPMGPFTRFLLLSAQRRGEVATMQWAHVDMDKALWTIPAELTKSGRIHLVPLSAAALEILKTVPTFIQGDHVWTTTSGAKPINGFSKGKERIEKWIRTTRNNAGIEKNIDGWTLHDLRRTATTMMAEPGKVTEQGVLPHILSAVLGHSASASVPGMPSAAITKVYNRYAYAQEKRTALQSWAEYVLNLVEHAGRRSATA